MGENTERRKGTEAVTQRENQIDTMGLFLRVDLAPCEQKREKKLDYVT